MKLKPSELLAEQEFWQIIENSLSGTNSVGLTHDRQEQVLEQELERLSRDQHLGFIFHFYIFFGMAYRNDLWAVAYIVMGGCGDDAFMDFRRWLIMRGKSVYKAALRDPDSLCDEFDKIPEGEIPLWDGYTDTSLFETRFGDEALAEYDCEFDRDELADPADPENHWRWDDEESIQRICPKVFDRWGENERF